VVERIMIGKIKMVFLEYLKGLFMARSREKELIDYVEREAKIAERFAIDNIDELSKQGSSFLTLLLSGAGGALALAISLRNNGAENWLFSGTLAVSCYLFLMSAIVVIRCLWSREIYPPANDPKNLYQALYSAEDIRRVELKNKQIYIDANTRRGMNMAVWLNRARLGSVLTPIIFAITYFIVS
jgi:hypothetical protein